MRLDITSKRGVMLIYMKSSFPPRIMSNFKLPQNIQVIPFELNFRRKKWLFVSHLYKVIIVSLTFIRQQSDIKVAFTITKWYS